MKQPPPSVRCGADACPVNAAGQCTMIACINIGADGRCQMVEDQTWEPAIKRRKYLCKGCGLEIRRDADGRWQHVGIALQHPASPHRGTEKE